MADNYGRAWVLALGIVIEAKAPVKLAKVKETCEALAEFGGDEYLPMSKRKLEATSWPLTVSSSEPLVLRWVKEAAAIVAEEIALETGLPLRKATQAFLARLRSSNGRRSRRCLDVASTLAIESGLDFWETYTTSSGLIAERPRRLSLPYPNSPEQLFAWALRCGLLMARRTRCKTEDERVYKRAKWAIESLRRFGVKVSPELEQEPVREVLRCLARAKTVGTPVSRPALLWCWKMEWDCYLRMALREKARWRAEAWDRAADVEPSNAVREVVVAAVSGKLDASVGNWPWAIN